MYECMYVRLYVHCAYVYMYGFIAGGELCKAMKIPTFAISFQEKTNQYCSHGRRSPRKVYGILTDTVKLFVHDETCFSGTRSVVCTFI